MQVLEESQVLGKHSTIFIRKTNLNFNKRFAGDFLKASYYPGDLAKQQASATNLENLKNVEFSWRKTQIQGMDQFKVKLKLKKTKALREKMKLTFNSETL